MSELTFGHLQANGIRFHYASQEPDPPVADGSDASAAGSGALSRAEGGALSAAKGGAVSAAKSGAVSAAKGGGKKKKEKAPLVLFLHGFPAYWYSWKEQLPAIAAAGYRAVAVDMRGYGDTDKPEDTKSYSTKRLAVDVRALIQALGYQKAVVVGHDWGGSAAWAAAIHQQDVVEKLVILNAPHPSAFARELRTFSQLKKSWYMFAFQVPVLAEAWLRRDDFGWIEPVLRGNAAPGTFSDADVELYKNAIAKPGALKAALSYYRAAFRSPPTREPLKVVQAPTLVLWGDHDSALGVELTRDLDPWVAHLRIQYIRGAGHFVHNERPAEVNAAILDFLGAPGEAAIETPDDVDTSKKPSLPPPPDGKRSLPQFGRS